MKRTKEDVKEAFVAVCNTAQPDHRRFGWEGPRERPREEVYPLDVDNVEWSYCQESGSFWAKCGPRGDRDQPVFFAGNWSKLRGMDVEQLIAVLCHEAAHITEGSQTDGGAHKPAFWRECSFIVGEVLDHPERVEAVLGDFDPQKVIGAHINDPNGNLIDGRVVTVSEQKQRLARLMRPWIDDSDTREMFKALGSAAVQAVGDSKD